MLAQLVPELALARVVTAGGPYRPGDEISLAFMTPTVSRLVAHDAELRAKCVFIENALIPEMISVLITHAAAPYEPGDILTLSFVDPRVARVYARTEHPLTVAGSEPSDSSLPPHLNETAGATGSGVHAPENIEMAPWAVDRTDLATPDGIRALPGANGHDSFNRDRDRTETGADERDASSTPADAWGGTTVATSGSDGTSGAGEARTASTPVRTGERMTLTADAVLGGDPRPESGVARAVDYAERRETGDRRGAGICVRLEWNQERLRRFVQVVDKLFTIDRLGWYRHSLAMRLLIPDEIASDDTLATVEAMRHLQALRAAAVESLGKPLLAACMPGFSITSEWLESLESSREARAIAGLRDALAPYANDDESIEAPPADATFTLGTVGRRQLIAENATSVEAFLPLLIATVSHDSALSARLTEYRRLLIDLFAQTARAGEPVRLHQMAQPNHSLDDRLWQLVGAAGEAFGGFAPA